MADAPPTYLASLESSSQQHNLTTPQAIGGLSRSVTPDALVPAKVVNGPGSAKLCLSLHQPNRYKAGETVSGFVQLASQHVRDVEIDVKSIAVTFSGRCKTTRPTRETHHHRKSVVLFAEKKVLFVGPARLHAPAQSARASPPPRRFPFDFTFPMDCSQAETENFETGPFFNIDRNQQLPASFTNDEGFDKALIIYELKTELLVPDENGYHMQESFFQTLSLNLHSPRTVQEPLVGFSLISNSFSHQSIELLPPSQRDFHRRPLTMKQRLGLTSVVKDRLPKACFTATVLVPSVAVIGWPLPLMLHIDHDVENSTIISPPIIYLRKLQVFLRTETSICGMKHLAMTSDFDQGGWTSSAKIVDIRFSRNLPRVEHLDLRGIMDLNVVPDLLPTFKTFDIARTYSLRVSAIVECAEKSFAIWTADQTRCIFLAKDYEPAMLNRDLAPPFSMNGQEDRNENGVPPPYESSRMNHPLAPSQPSDPLLLDSHYSRHSSHHVHMDHSGAAAASASAAAAAASTASCGASAGGGGC